MELRGRERHGRAARLGERAGANESNALQLLMNPIQIKICGVTNPNDARACVELGADMIGFNFYPVSPRYIEPTIVREIVDALPARTCAVSVFVDADPAEIRKLATI